MLDQHHFHQHYRINARSPFVFAIQIFYHLVELVKIYCSINLPEQMFLRHKVFHPYHGHDISSALPLAYHLFTACLFLLLLYHILSKKATFYGDFFDRLLLPFIKLTEEEKERANTSSIVDYLTAHGEKVERAGREYVWEAPSGKVSVHGCEWYSQYELVGGGAIGFVQKFFGLSYPDAVRSLLGNNINVKAIGEKKPSKTEEKKPFELPEKHTDTRRVYGYLIHERLIDRQVLNRFVKDGLIYEDAKYHNAVFIGKNSEGIPVHAQRRATSAKSDFKGNLDSSIAEYSFHFTGTSEYLFVFEAPIDMLAYISMHKQGWENHSYVALCSTADRAAIQMLKDNPHLKTVYLCLDNDNAGQLGCERISKAIHELGEYSVWRVHPQNKDWDEDLKALNGREAIPASGPQPSEPEPSLTMTM